ncbi:MAG: hypothetical protein BJ554DRAFT_4446, partial [Olpidium bornovanus]
LQQKGEEKGQRGKKGREKGKPLHFGNKRRAPPPSPPVPPGFRLRVSKSRRFAKSASPVGTATNPEGGGESRGSQASRFPLRAEVAGGGFRAAGMRRMQNRLARLASAKMGSFVGIGRAKPRPLCRCGSGSALMAMMMNCSVSSRGRQTTGQKASCHSVVKDRTMPGVPAGGGGAVVFINWPSTNHRKQQREQPAADELREEECSDRGWYTWPSQRGLAHAGSESLRWSTSPARGKGGYRQRKRTWTKGNSPKPTKYAQRSSKKSIRCSSDHPRFIHLYLRGAVTSD